MLELHLRCREGFHSQQSTLYGATLFKRLVTPVSTQIQSEISNAVYGRKLYQECCGEILRHYSVYIKHRLTPLYSMESSHTHRSPLIHNTGSSPRSGRSATSSTEACCRCRRNPRELIASIIPRKFTICQVKPTDHRSTYRLRAVFPIVNPGLRIREMQIRPAFLGIQNGIQNGTVDSIRKTRSNPEATSIRRV